MLDQKGYLYAKYPNDPLIRGSYYKFRKKYVKACKRKRNEYKTDVISKLEQLHDKDPKAYWKLLDDLKKEDSSDHEPQISAEEWVDHFSSINTISEKFSARADAISDLLTEQEKRKEFSELDYQITSKELYSAVISLKNNKAVGFDAISNEMLKCGFNCVQNCLLKLFNTVLTAGSYPTNWKQAYLTPVHKGGSLDNPNNYRGISILSCVAKLFNTILTKRLDNFLDTRKLINPVQIGFTKKARTSDHMFVLRTLIEKYTKDKNAKLYACFIDFQKAFDRVIHEIMLYKLCRLGISCNFYSVIKDMYVSNYLSVRTKYGFTQPFMSNIGVRQGDTLSPDLFKIFINDFPDIFDDSCGGVEMGTYHLNCLLYADDVILLSQNEAGLQSCINKLEKYCDDWCLEVNLNKSKIMVFSKSGKLYNNDFFFKGNKLECVREYKYLGVTFCISGTFSVASKELYKKALKGIFKLKSVFGSIYPKSSVALHIFDHTIKPILTYGSEIWGSMCKTVRASDYTLEKLYQNLHGEKLHIKFCKYVLGVHSKSSNLACIGELGRFPVYNDICDNILKFYFYAKQKNNDSLIGQTLQTSISLEEGGYKSWYTGVKTILRELKLNEHNCDLTKHYLKNLYKDVWRKKLEDEAVLKKGKLRTFYTFKSTFQKEIYLDILNDRTKQQVLTQLRISAHRLEIEYGRYTRKPIGDRLCKKCCYNQVEDEVHFLCDCSLYNSERDTFFNYVKNMVPSFGCLSSADKMVWLMTCENKDIIQKLADYVYACFKLRKIC